MHTTLVSCLYWHFEGKYGDPPYAIDVLRIEITLEPTGSLRAMTTMLGDRTFATMPVHTTSQQELDLSKAMAETVGTYFDAHQIDGPRYVQPVNCHHCTSTRVQIPRAHEAQRPTSRKEEGTQKDLTVVCLNCGKTTTWDLTRMVPPPLHPLPRTGA